MFRPRFSCVHMRYKHVFRGFAETSAICCRFFSAPRCHTWDIHGPCHHQRGTRWAVLALRLGTNVYSPQNGDSAKVCRLHSQVLLNTVAPAAVFQMQLLIAERLLDYHAEEPVSVFSKYFQACTQVLRCPVPDKLGFLELIPDHQRCSFTNRNRVKSCR